MNNGIKITVIMSVLGASTLITAGDFRSPLSVARGYMHWELQPIEETAWYNPIARCDRPDWMLHYHNRSLADIENPDVNCSQWYFETWSAAFTRSAHNAYFNDRDCNGERKHGSTSHTESLATLFLGTEAFRGVEAFPNGTLDPLVIAQNNPLLGAAFIRPTLDYHEKGVYWGGHVEYRWGNENKWHVGGRLSVPVKVVEVEVEDANEETLEDLFSVRAINRTVNGPDVPLDQNDLAIRFDFLRSLALDQVTPLLRVTGTGDTTNLIIAEANLSAPSANELEGVPAMYGVRATNIQELIELSAENANSGSFRRQASEVNGALPASGLGGNDGTVFFFQTGTQYQTANNLFGNETAQDTLFIVPRAIDSDPDELSLQTANAVNRILTTVQLADLTDRLASDFFTDQGINIFGTDRVIGLGDMEADIYVGYGDRSLQYIENWRRPNWYADFDFGIKIPTGTKKKEKNALRIFRLETGNDRHWEVSVGLEGGVQLCNWFAMKMGYSFHHAIKASQWMGATFTGATVRGVGPAVKADVAWNYQCFNVDFNFFHPCNKDLGWVFGYELFAKGKDHISFCPDMINDFLGNPATLDDCAAEAHTRAMLHKLRGEIFHRWNFFEIFAGGSHAVGGRDAMKESEGHIGFVVYF